MDDTISYIEAAKIMISAASDAISGGYTITEGYILTADQMDTVTPAIIVEVMGEVQWHDVTKTGAFNVIIAEKANMDLSPAQNKRVVAAHANQLIDKLWYLSRTYPPGWLDYCRFSNSENDIQTGGLAFLASDTNYRLSTFTFEWGLSE